MPHGHERTDRLLDEIDDLVDASLVRGDQSGTWQGERYDRCTVASFQHPWHYLPVTENLEAMRRGSFGTDEFGQGLVDPDYSYSDDESRILCPGSLFVGPPTSDREWEWCVREWGPKRPGGTSFTTPSSSRLRPATPRHGARTWRLKPIPTNWDVVVDSELEYIRSDPDFPHTGRGPRTRDIPVGTRQRMTFNFHPIHNPSPEWVQRYLDQQASMTVTHEGLFVQMEPIAFDFISMQVWAEPNLETGEVTPTHVDIVTPYPMHMHGWWNEFWEDITEPVDRPGHEADIVIIDEAYQIDNERLRHHVEEAQSAGRRPPSQEAYDEAQR